jgi:hypothetical protein
MKMIISTPKPTITPISTDREELQTQIDEQVKVLYAQKATVEEKEIAVLNYRKLVNYYGALFQVLPAETTL